MSLYLCVCTGDCDAENEVAAVDVGPYDFFGRFRDDVAATLEGGRWGSRFPTLMLHSDSDGEWTAAELPALRAELRAIADTPVAAAHRAVSGRPLVSELLALVAVASLHGLPITFA